MRQIAILLACLSLIGSAAAADNRLLNPSAEEAGQAGAPKGWGLYVGAGKMKLSLAAEEKRSGRASACLDLTGWYTPKDAKDTPENHSLSGAIVVPGGNGYSPVDALECAPGDCFAFSFWYKGTVKSAYVSAVGWPNTKAGHADRIHHAVSGGPMRPGPDWQRCTGTVRIKDGVRRFTLMIHASGSEKTGFTLGKLYVDDAEIAPKMFPGGELRAMWCSLPKAKERAEGMRQMAELLDKPKDAGINTLFVWTTSLYVAAVDRRELQSAEPQAAWDSLGELIRAAKQRGIQVHVWYSPWVYKSASRSVEMRDHPEWAAVSAQGVVDKDGICIARPEVRRAELDLIGRLVDRYPDLAGIHIEEPGYNWGADYCYCDHCRKLLKEWFGLDVAKNPDAAKPVVHNLAAFMSTDFMARLRQMLLDRRPALWLSANGSGGTNPDWYIGRDWTTWARRGYIDFYVPQLYTKSVDAFAQRGRETKSCLGDCTLITGMAVSWSGIYPERQKPETIQAEIDAARKLGAKGFVIFHRDHCYDEHFAAIRESKESARKSQ